MIAFTATGADLASAAAFAAQIAPSRTSSPELGAAVVDVDAVGPNGEGTATLSAYDQTTAGSSTVSADVMTPGRLLVSARLLHAIASTTTRESQVTIEADQTTATVHARRSTWELPLLSERYYPQLPKPGDPLGVVDGPALADALRRVSSALGEVSSPPMFGGACFAGGPATLELAATDRWRLSVAKLDWEASALLPDTIVAGSALEKMAFAARRESTVSLHLSASGLSLVGQHHWVHAPLMANPNPSQWRKVNLDSGDTSTTAVVNAVDLKEIIARASALLDPKDALIISIGEGALQVGPLDGVRGRTDHACEAAVTGEDRVIGVDGEYLRQGVIALDAPTIRVDCFGVPRRGMFLMTPLDESGEPIPGFRHVIMAKRVLNGEAAAAAA
jgi:DNA polymerase-3 subunit beta